MTATDELRKLLDERGVKWKSGNFIQPDAETQWGNNRYTDYPELLPFLTISNCMPEQAIAATLGRGTCKMEQIPECQFDDIACSECGVALWAFSMDKAGEGVFATPNYCPYCGAKVVEQ